MADKNINDEEMTEMFNTEDEIEVIPGNDSETLQEDFITDTDNSFIKTETEFVENTGPSENLDVATKLPQEKLTKLPFSRIMSIMKMDPDVNLINSEAIFLVTKATELFLETIAKETYSYMATKKRKVIAKKDLDYVVNVVDCLCFLDGAMDF